jgi:hypothetical protein
MGGVYFLQIEFYFTEIILLNQQSEIEEDYFFINLFEMLKNK